MPQACASSIIAPMAAHPERLGKYEIRREIGKGSMGVVYEAYDAVIQRRVAIKMIRRDDFGTTQGDELVARLKREAQAAGRLNHPGIVAIHDYGEEPGDEGHPVAYIAMEFIEGTDLRQWVDAGHVRTPVQAATIVTAILQALQHAHERGVTHRDIKPANVFMLHDGAVKLADFGVARIEASELTQAGTIIGTPMYMSPEQILGLPVDGRSDLFSCGVLLYELLTGAPPFSGSVTTVIHQVLEVDPEPPSRRSPTLGPAWDRLMARVLAKKPEQRPATAREMAVELVQTLSKAGAGDADATVVLATPTAAASVTEPPPPAASGAAAARKAAPIHVPTPVTAPVPGVTPARAPGRLLPLFAAIAGLGAIAVGGFYVAWRGHAVEPRAIATEALAPASPAMPAAVAPPAATAAMAAADAGTSATPAASGIVASAAASARTGPSPAAAPVPAPAIPRPSTPAPERVAPPTPAPPPSVAAAPPPATAPAPTRAADRAPGKATRAAGPAIEASSSPRPTTAAAVAAPFDWSDRVSPARFEAVPVPNRLSEAMRRLLEPLGGRDADRLQEFDALLAEQRRPFAYAIGVRDGRFVHAWAQGADATLAAAAAQRLCAERARGRFCPTVQVNGTFLRGTFLVAARQLGTESPSTVREAWMRTVDEAIRELRITPAAAATVPAPAPASAPASSLPPSPPVGASAPAAAPGAWARARARLREGAPRDIADGFATLLDVQSPDDRRRLDRLQTEVHRLRWKSALAVGVTMGGTLAWSAVQGESRNEWAEERALADCANQVPAPGCVIVSANGDLRASALSILASRLGARPQSEVREAFLRSIGRRWP